MTEYLIKMTTYDLNDYIHNVVNSERVDKVLQGYNKDDLLNLVDKMEKDLERWRDKENMYPADWERFIAAINKRVKTFR